MPLYKGKDFPLRTAYLGYYARLTTSDSKQLYQKSKRFSECSRAPRSRWACFTRTAQSSPEALDTQTRILGMCPTPRPSIVLALAQRLSQRSLWFSWLNRAAFNGKRQSQIVCRLLTRHTIQVSAMMLHWRISCHIPPALPFAKWSSGEK